MGASGEATFILVTLLGIIMIVLGLLILFTAYRGRGVGGVEKEYGAVVVIGPIPIIVGSSKKAAVIAGIVAIAVLLAFLVVFYLR